MVINKNIRIIKSKTGKDLYEMDCINSNCSNRIIRLRSTYEKASNDELETGFACCVKCNFSPDAMECKRKKLFEKYGVINQFQRKDVKEKIKNTWIKKYGVENPGQIEALKNSRENKRKQTNIKKYGVENTLSVPEIQIKIKNTNLDKYGSIRAISQEEYKQKMYTTNIKKYGSKVPSQSIDLREKFGNEWTKKLLSSRKETFYNKLKQSNRLNDVECLFSFDEYSDHLSLLKWKCLKCNTEFDGKLQYGWNPRCPACYPKLNGFSNGEKEIADWIRSLGIEIEENIRTIISPYELDIFIPSYQLAIEFDGLYWHSDHIKDKSFHITKTKMCEEHDIRLIHIFEDEWINKKEIVKSRLINIFGLNTNRIGARKCLIKEIDIKLKNEFLEKYHIQGSDKSNIKLGAFYENNLIGVMTFSLPRRSLGKNKKYLDIYELSRFATISNTYTPGLASRLLKAFIRKYDPMEIYSYADRRWSLGNLYESIGFKFDSFTPINYWYWKNNVREHRFKYRKDQIKKLFPSIFNSKKTEFEMMDELGFYRIWDCGNYKYIWRKNENSSLH